MLEEAQRITNSFIEVKLKLEKAIEVIQILFECPHGTNCEKFYADTKHFN